MKKEIKTQVQIHAPKEVVWSILSDFENYPSWNPFIVSLEGNTAVGSQLKVRIVPPKSKPMVFKPKVISYENNFHFSWLGSLGIKGVFDGLHAFRLEENSDGSVTFHQSESFAGILVRFINLDKTREGFELMNQKLKVLAEEKAK